MTGGLKLSTKRKIKEIIVEVLRMVHPKGLSSVEVFKLIKSLKYNCNGAYLSRSRLVPCLVELRKEKVITSVNVKETVVWNWLDK